MLSTKIKEATKEAHQQLERQVVLKLKAIRNNADYAGLLKHFYAYFNAVEKAIAPYITNVVLPDYAERRNSSYLKTDIKDLGATTEDLSRAKAPAITNLQEALGALYVMEGSIMGGSIIVQMLAKYGVEKGVSFFSGYGEQTGEMWAKFIGVLNANAQNEDQQEDAIVAANKTFSNFAKMFETVEVN